MKVLVHLYSSFSACGVARSGISTLYYKQKCIFMPIVQHKKRFRDKLKIVNERVPPLMYLACNKKDRKLICQYPVQ